MACPPLRRLRRASPALAARIAAAAAATTAAAANAANAAAGAAGAGSGHDAPVAQPAAPLLVLYGPYRVWEEVMSHAASRGGAAFERAAHAYPLEALLPLLATARAHGFAGLARRYARLLGGARHLRRATCAVVLRAATQTRSWGLGLRAFRFFLDQSDPSANGGGSGGGGGGSGGGGGGVGGGDDEAWRAPAADAVGAFLLALFDEPVGWSAEPAD